MPRTARAASGRREPSRGWRRRRPPSARPAPGVGGTTACVDAAASAAAHDGSAIVVDGGLAGIVETCSGPGRTATSVATTAAPATTPTVARVARRRLRRRRALAWTPSTRYGSSGWLSARSVRATPSGPVLGSVVRAASCSLIVRSPDRGNRLVGQQRPQAGQSLGGLALHRADAAAHGGRRVGFAQVLVEAQHESGPLARRHEEQRPAQPIAAVDGAVLIGVGRLRQRRRREPHRASDAVATRCAVRTTTVRTYGVGDRPSPQPAPSERPPWPAPSARGPRRDGGRR